MYTGQDGIHVPKPRARHTSALVGHPPAYMLVFGGYTVETRARDNLFIHRALDDFWSFSLFSHRWI